MIGSTGTGKTAVAAMAAEAIGAKMLRVSAPNWMPAGANNRGTRETIRVVAAHVANNDRTLLVIDECEKICDREGDNSWKMYCRGEIYDLCDGRWPTGLTQDDDDDSPYIEALTIKLRDTVFICAIGTFQDWFDSAGCRQSIGFGTEIDSPEAELTADIVAKKMPRELANRFHSGLIRISELTPDDYHRVARDVENQLPLHMRAAFRAEVARLLPGAIAAKKGIRFFEDAMLETLINLPPKPEVITAEIVKPNSEIAPVINQCTL